MARMTVMLHKEVDIALDFNTLAACDAAIRNAHGIGLTRAMIGLVEGELVFDALRLAYTHALRAGTGDKTINALRVGEWIDAAMNPDRDDGVEPVSYAQLAMNILELLEKMGIIELEQRATGGEEDDEGGNASGSGAGRMPEMRESSLL